MTMESMSEGIIYQVSGRSRDLRSRLRGGRGGGVSASVTIELIMSNYDEKLFYNNLSVLLGLFIRYW